VNSHPDMPEVLSPSIRWFFINPVFLSIELILIFSIINIEFLYPNELFIGSSFLLLFAFIYYFLDFSPITSIQTFLIILAVFIQIIFSFFSITIPQFLIPLMLIFSVIVSGLIYFFFSKVIIDNGIVIFKSNSVKSKNVSIESRIRTIGGIFGFGDIILHYKKKKYVISGINNNIEIRRKMIDNHQLQPHKQTATWSGTLVLFLICTMILFSPIILCLVYFYIYFSSFAIPLRILFSVSLTLFLSVLILNIRLPRKNINPASDLLNLKLIDTGMWTQIFQWNELLVVKQLFRCGWGHNNYNDHKAPIIGKKMCGKWNPIALVIMHNLMLIYQMIGIHRRKIYEHHIDAIPRTYTIPGRKFRYLQEYVSKPLNLENMPEDINDQFILLNEQLERSGLFIDDIHAGNVRINSDGKIKLVDGELYTDGEVLIKNFLVNGIDNRLNGMEKVLGCERIIRWVDHRVSVDDLLKQR
tara:strand:- start:973 stop:2382 length:1410 start_codon:yes stop_codon:yes gene_type:complete